MTKINLTPAETAIVKVLHTIDHMSDGPMEADYSGVWGGCITDRIRLIEQRNMAGAMGILSSLVKKGVLRPEGDIEEDGHWMVLTRDGYLTWAALQEEEPNTRHPEPVYCSKPGEHGKGMDMGPSATEPEPEAAPEPEWTVTAFLHRTNDTNVWVRVEATLPTKTNGIDPAEIEQAVLEESRRIAVSQGIRQTGGVPLVRLLDIDGSYGISRATSFMVHYGIR
jgi:hypothetical protein